MSNDVSNLLCALCFYSLETEEKKFPCGNPKCVNKICFDCFRHLIHYSYENKVLPSCPVQNCREIYLDSDLNGLNLSLKEKYRTACFDFFLKSDGDSIQKDILEREIIDKIRADKLQFLEKSFPPAVGLVSRVAFKQKLHKINEHKKELVHLKLTSNKKKCFFQSCNGFLDENDKIWVCFSCESRFCKKCEKEIDVSRLERHHCNENDVQSLAIINGMIRCPGCDIPVFKNVGCDFITCSNCSTNFHYKTGEISNHGSTNVKIQLAPEQRLLSALYRNELNEKTMELILLIESLRPPVVSKDIILRPIHRSLKNNNVTNRKNNEKELVYLLEKYTRYKYNARDYVQTISKIEKRFLSSSCSSLTLEEFLRDALDSLRKK